MFIKVDQLGNILGHDYHQHDDFSVEVSESILVDLNSGVYKFKYVDGALVALSELEMKNHPVRIQNKLMEIRAKRDQLLSDCDFIMVSDSPVTDACKINFASYRQQLRDLPGQISDVDSFHWPTKPQYIGK
jgi:hypothetical protein